MFIEVLSHVAVTTAFGAYEHSSELKQSWKKLKYRFRHGKLSILIVGAGGVGKSTLAKFLSNPTEKVPPNEYMESFQVERCDLPGGVVAELVTAPGQSRHLDTWDALFEAAKADKKAFGIINVSAYGYHSTALEIRAMRLNNETTELATKRYIGESRLREIEVLSDLSDRLKRHNIPIWMISLISKQDLWWNERANVERHYTEGAYGETVKKLSSSHAVSGFRHEYFSVALHAQNFVDGGGQVVIPTAGGYDDKIKYHHQEKLLAMILGFISPN